MADRSAPRTARALAREYVDAEILRLARQQLTQVGPAELSVRAIARDLGMASSAVYRYVASRDELLTKLLIQVYGELADAVDAADAAQPREDCLARFRAIAHAIRTWAITHPHDYRLLYGTPVPGYQAPEDTIAPASRVTGRLIDLFVRATEAGVRAPALSTPLRDAERVMLAPIRALLPIQIDDAMLVRGVMAWTALFGTVSFELGGQFTGGIGDAGLYYARTVDELAASMGLLMAPGPGASPDAAPSPTPQATP